MMMERKLQTDCFGYAKGGCTVLNEPLCATCGHCSFYKTKAQAKADTERAKKLAEKAGFVCTYRPKGD
ncbi:hypothetical protein CE91St43_05450 [Oscillospiraceae bacterium]|nr:hypothetical protein CE91St43_05450 [Oscillospiraceae bacterium]